MYKTLQKIKFLCVTSKYRRSYHIFTKRSPQDTHHHHRQEYCTICTDGHETRGQMQKKHIYTDPSTRIIVQTLSEDNVEHS